MKLTESKYMCDWCEKVISQTINRWTGNGRHTLPPQIVCPNCQRFVSQTTKFERDKKK